MKFAFAMAPIPQLLPDPASNTLSARRIIKKVLDKLDEERERERVKFITTCYSLV